MQIDVYVRDNDGKSPDIMDKEQQVMKLCDLCLSPLTFW